MVGCVDVAVAVAVTSLPFASIPIHSTRTAEPGIIEESGNGKQAIVSLAVHLFHIRHI